MDNRAQAHGLVVFFAMLVTGALLFTIFQPGVENVLNSMLAQTDNQAAKDVINTRLTIWGYILFYVLFVAGLTLIARSVLQSRSPG